MSSRSAAALLVLTAALSCGPPARAEGPSLTTVAFPSADGVQIQGRLHRPAGAGPFPAIVALHGCGGMHPVDAPPRPGFEAPLSARHRDWSERWVGRGFAVLHVDSFGPRGLTSVCRDRERPVRPGRERAADVAGARQYLQARPDIRADRLALVGWSHGGSTVLWSLANARAPTDGKPDYWRAVAFYPGCSGPAQARLGVRIPLLLLIGEDDDWTPAGPCREFAQSRTARVTAVFYPGAYHGFDAPNQPVIRLSGLAFTPDGSGVARIGTDAAARADAIRRLGDFLQP